MDLSSAERSAFKEEEVALILRNVIKDTLENETYDDDRVGEWINEICERTIKELYELNKPFKYMVTCAIKQRTGAAIHTGTSCFWDIGSDGVASVVWPKRKSGLDQTMTCIAHAFAVALSP